MSETMTAPKADAATLAWHATMKTAFGVGQVAASVENPAQGLSAARVVTLQKTYDTIRVQPPEVAMRPMQGLASELAAGELTALDAGGQPSREAVALKRQVDAELGTLKGKAVGIANRHIAEWQGKIAALPAAAASAAPADKAARAKAIQSVVGLIKAGVDRDTYMLRQVGAKTEALEDISDIASALKMEYKDLLPQRTTAGPPAKIPAATKPAIKGNLTETDAADLTKAMKDTQALMGADKKVDAAVVEKAVALIDKGINAARAKTALQDLKTWDGVKAHYRDLAKEKSTAEAAKAFMAEMWWFRRMTVDKVMTDLQKKYDFTWGSVGSDNPESDYDLTVRTHGKKADGSVKWDYQIVEEANGDLSEEFGGTPPGILFDTNLYAEAAAAPQALSDEQQASPAVKAMGAMKEQGQDVGALMKLRRFMEWDEYEDYKVKMLAGIAAPEDRALVTRQFEEADALYFVARAEQLTKAAELDHDQQALDEIKAIPLTPEGQKKLLEMAEKLEHDATKSMAANNAIYLKKLDQVRVLEKQYDEADDAVTKAGLLARLKSYQADATFFAAEAYHSEGPLQHVVKAGQSSKLEIEGNGVTYESDAAKDKAIDAKKQEKLAGLSANQMLQSFNENLGDLLKDLKHYGSEPNPGLGFYRSSKYIERLCDAVAIIQPKLPAGSQAAFGDLTIGGMAPSQVQIAVAGLVEIRGEKKGFPAGPGGPADPEMEKQAYAIEEMGRIFPSVTTLPDLAKVMKAFGQQVNAIVRSAITSEMRAMQDNPYFPKDGKA